MGIKRKIRKENDKDWEGKSPVWARLVWPCSWTMIAVLGSESSHASEERWEGYTKNRENETKSMNMSEERERHTINWDSCSGRWVHINCMHGYPRSRFSVLLHHLPYFFVVSITSIESKNKRYLVPSTQIQYLTASYLSFSTLWHTLAKRILLAEGSYYPFL